MKENRTGKAKIFALTALFALAFFVVYSFLPLSAPARDNSPDENSNRFFSTAFAENGRLWWVEPMNYLAPGMIHPRSVRVQDEFLLPGGFLGLPTLYGGIASVVGVWSLPFLTAVFALLGLIGFWLVVNMFFDQTGLIH